MDISWTFDGETFLRIRQATEQGYTDCPCPGAADLMGQYISLSNNLVKMKQMKGRFTPEQIAQQADSMDQARSMFLATIATMQKYASLTEDQVNNQSYSLVLEHLERLSKENEEMEKIRKK